ncbi:DUF349 domain-containing protein [Thioalkalicoccus limnaeus]|uniref:DUF349 domain-containing protein n=1 Tax=Thioalkalicoccus limnaeus TaxID=120681 RepID=A0ABV4BK25_9GAMM
MIFERFLKKRRVDAADPRALDREIRDSDDVAARREACRRLSGLADLRRIAAADPDAGVRDVAWARYRHLLCGLAEPRLPLDERLAELAATDDERTLEQIATTAHEPEMRHAAIERVTSAATLGQCALRDPLAGNRQTAVERLTDKAALERVAREIGKRDKRVYRLAKDRLKAMAEQEARPLRIRAQCAELCEKIERLGRFEQWEQDRGMLDLIERDWARIADEADETSRTRYDAGRARFLAAFEEYRAWNDERAAKQRALAERHAAIEALLAELNDAVASGDEVRIVALRERAEQLTTADPTAAETKKTGADKRLAEALDQLQQQLTRLRDDRAHHEQARALLVRLADTLALTQPLNKGQVLPLIQDARRLGGDRRLPADLAEALHEAGTTLEQRWQKQRQHAEQRLTQVPAKLAALTESLTAGELKRAEPLLQSLQATIDLAQASGLPRQAYGEIQHHIRATAPRVKELQSWRRWGADQQREALCQAVNELVERDLPDEALVDELRQLQTAWKSLDQGGAPADQRRWEQFQASADQVYQRCRPYLERQTAEREANRRAREQLCQELETFLDRVDWDRMDWKKAVKAEREMRRSWSELGPVEIRHRRPLERRFHAALRRLDRHLDTERTRNRHLREELIAEVEALAEQPDLDRAIEAAKACQQRWHTTVPGRKADENALWRRFRAACDLVFGRRRAQIEARTSEQQDNQASREAICDEALALATSEASASEIEQALREIDQRWRDTSHLPVPRQAAAAISQRWRNARQTVRDSLRQRKERDRRASFALLAEQAEICALVERTVTDDRPDPDDLAALKTRWSGLPRHPDEGIQTAIGARFATALAMAERGDPPPLELLAENQEEREALCLKLEILAQVDSPAERVGDRLALQVARLTERMAAGEQDPLANAAGLLAQWYLCGPAPADPALEQRFARACDALEQRGQTGDDDAS